MTNIAIPPPFDPKLFKHQATGNLYVFGDNTEPEGGPLSVHPRCCWLLPPGSSRGYGRRISTGWQLEPYAIYTVAVAGSPKKLYALFTAYLLTGYWPTYEKGHAPK
jgi:hypothetical protein